MTTFTTAGVAKILGLSNARIRACVRSGLVSPRKGAGGHLVFEFQDLLLLKTTKDLLEARVPVKQIRRMLASLRRQFPGDQHLSTITIYADGRRVVAWDGKARWQPDSGQFLFNFDAQDVVEKVPTPIAARRIAERSMTRSMTGEEWFHLASELEATSPDEARRAYQHALEQDPGLADAHVNLGRLFQQAREFATAEAHYRVAAQQAPDDAIPWFNMGVLLDDVGRRQEAIQAYRKSLERDPDLADAHYNLGLLYEALGRRSEAMAHLRRARALYGRPASRN
jgi:tetratricopeptide (TPR) repeat protein